MLVVLADPTDTKPSPIQPILPAQEELSTAIWIDAMDPSAEELGEIKAATGIAPPARGQLTEIESSSRLAERDGTLFLSLPLAIRGTDGSVVTTPLGVVLTAQHMLTVRFDSIPTLEAYAEAVRQGREAAPTNRHALVGLLEHIVDSLADMLERSRAQLDTVSRKIFAQGGAPARGGAELHGILQMVGRAGEDVSAVRDTLLVLGRITAFVARSEPVRKSSDLEKRIKTLRADLASLNDYDEHVGQKVQFLLDAIVGLINIAQSNIIKLMTVVGVVGVPPTLIASIYGMNFEVMPELHSPWGYPLSLLAIVASAIVPIMWFKRKGWL